VDCLAPGACIFGTYSKTFPAGGDADKYYYEMLDSMVDITDGIE